MGEVADEDVDAIRERFDKALLIFKNEYLEKTFREADADNSGCIDHDEFKTLCWKLDGAMDDRSIANALREVDANGDGQIDLAEFKQWWSSESASNLREKHKAMVGVEEWDEYEIQKRTYDKMNGLSESRLRRTFDSIDEDGSGMIEWGEFRRLMRRLAPATPDEKVASIFAEIDEDGSGEIDFEEFSRWWTSPEGKALRGEDKREAEQAAKLQALKVKVIARAEQRQAAKIIDDARREEEEQVAREEAKAAAQAATAVQAAARGRAARASVTSGAIAKEQTDRKTAALQIQSVVRGRAGRTEAAQRLQHSQNQRELSTAEELRTLYWGEGEMAAREARLRADYARLKATVPTSMASVTFEQWRWQWLENQSGGLLSRFASVLQHEHGVRLVQNWADVRGTAALPRHSHSRAARPSTAPSTASFRTASNSSFDRPPSRGTPRHEQMSDAYLSLVEDDSVVTTCSLSDIEPHGLIRPRHLGVRGLTTDGSRPAGFGQMSAAGLGPPSSSTHLPALRRLQGGRRTASGLRRGRLPPFTNPRTPSSASSLSMLASST